MKWTIDQIKLIAIMFKIQYADKTLGEVFPGCRCSENLIGDVLITNSVFDGDILFVFGLEIQTLVARMKSSTGKFYMLGSNGCPMEDKKIEELVNMLNFGDKV